MNRKSLSDYSKIIVIGLGSLVIGVALFSLPWQSINWGYPLILAFSVFIAPRISLALPRSNFILSFSDSVVFLTFLIYGGEMAIVTAFIETFANCFYLKTKGIMYGRWTVLFNASLASVVTGISYGVFILASGFIDSNLNLNNTRTLVAVLGFFSLTQFITSSVFAAAYQNITSGSNIWETLKKQCLSSSLTQFTGAGLAGLVFKLINFADLLIIGIASVGLGLIYFSYRQSIGEINAAIGQVEEAERQKAETERERRREAEKHANLLGVSLEKEERANAALRKSEKDFQHAALHDSLTGLANRKQFGDILRDLIAEYKENPTISFQVLFLDIRSFKNINDTLGHTIGDKVLAIAAKRFSRLVNSEDTVARIGGDEFAIILRNLSSSGKAQKVARRIYESITQPFSLSGNKISIDLNIGIAPCDAEYNTPEEILRDADIAMHFAKEKNDGLAVFTKELRSRFQERVRFEMDLRQAIERKELAVHYQPIISLSDGRLIGFEALMRWHHSEFGMIPPNKFIPIAETSGQIQQLTVWILSEATTRLAEWQKIGSEYNDLMVSVNISGKHLSNDDLIEDVETVLEESRLRPETLKLEITESSAMENAEYTVNVLKKLKQIGVQLSIDDFGTGYSSLSYLQRLPFDTLKIDRSFVYSVGENGENSEILQTIISLAKNLKMRVIAEGIETESQFFVLQNLGCDYGQGFLMAKPKGREETERLLYERPNWVPFLELQHFSENTQTVGDENLPVF